MPPNSSQIRELDQLTDYERWSLTELSKLAGDIDLGLYTVETLLEKPVGRELKLDGTGVVYVRVGTGGFGSGVDEAIRNITPLIFVSSYKSLDLFIEWLLEINGENPSGNNWTFREKTSRLDSLGLENLLNIPSILNTEPLIFECLTNLYTELEDSRHAIVHRSDFELADSRLIVNNESGDTYTFNSEELFSFAGSVLICINTVVTDTYDFVTERQLKTTLDNLSNIHNVPQFGLTNYESSIIHCARDPIQTDPYQWEIPLDRIIELVSENWENKDFWLEFVGLHNDDVVSKWLIPGDELIELSPELIVPSTNFEEYTA